MSSLYSNNCGLSIPIPTFRIILANRAYKLLIHAHIAHINVIQEGESFTFEGAKTDVELATGNAVPVNLAKYIGLCIAEYCESNAKSF